MFIRGISGETGNIFCCVQHKDVRGETTIRVLGLNDERLNGPRLDAYAEAYNKMGEVFDWIKLLRDAPSDAVRSSLRRTKEDVNRIWHGEKSYTAFGRLRNEPAGSLFGRLSTGLARRGPMAFEPFWARSAHVMQFRPVTMDQATKDVANNGEDMHAPNSPKLVPRCGYCRPLWTIGRTLCGGNVK